MDPLQEKVKQQVWEEFHSNQNPNAQVEQLLHQGGATQRFYGGAEHAGPHEMQLVKAWRPTPNGEWEMGTGVVHRVHHEDGTLTVQFIPDQHRCRLPRSSVQPITDITPVYPAIRLSEGERLPTPAEIRAREENANAMRMQYGIPPEAPLPGQENTIVRPEDVLAGHKRPAVLANRWGMPATTLDALRNRAVPEDQLSGAYGVHHYTKLYQQNFYPQQDHVVAMSGTVGVEEAVTEWDRLKHVTSHTYIPLQGPELEQDMETGAWRAKGEAQQEDPDAGPGLLG